MKIRFIGQACVIISTADCHILCDPWLFGTAFNDSWRHFPDPAWDEALYDLVTHVWISHEHPDHFHIPTLKAMPEAFKRRVTLLYQKNNSVKMPKAFKSLGFDKITLLPNRQKVDIAPQTRVYNHQVGQMDSALAVLSEGKTVLNLNDCEANTDDCARFRKDLGSVEVVLNQFSMAGYNGEIHYDEVLPREARKILDNMLENHRDLGAQVTIPFASNVYFCCEDNRHINLYGNSPVAAHAAFEAAGLRMEVLYPGDTYHTETGRADTQGAITRFADLYARRDELVRYDRGPLVELDKIREAFLKRAAQIKEVYPTFIVKRLGRVRVRIPDLGETVEISLAEPRFEQVPASEGHDLIINSQPFYFAFATPFGVQTLGVSARWLIQSKQGVWRWYRIITSLNNAEIWLKPRYLFTRQMLNFLRERLDGGFNQLRYQLSRMRS